MRAFFMMPLMLAGMVSAAVPPVNSNLLQTAEDLDLRVFVGLVQDQEAQRAVRRTRFPVVAIRNCLPKALEGLKLDRPYSRYVKSQDCYQ